MKHSLKFLLAAGAMALASAGAMAQTTVNVAPAPFPIPRVGDSNAGGVIVTAFDSARGLSVTQYLNIQNDDIGVAQLTPDSGLIMNFGSVDLSVFGGNLTNVVYGVAGGDYFGDAPNQWSLSFTAALDQQTTFLNTDNTANSLNAINTLQNFLNQSCASIIACVATSPAAGPYSGGPTYGTNLGNGIPFATVGSVGTALSFWQLTSQDDFLGAEATVTQYANANGIGRWLLGTDGSLSYQIAGGTAPVPLPAAAWLLLSGLGGLGVISRRRTAQAA